MQIQELDRENRINRWHMNRLGFVHFWLYDHEIFSFENGKMLLRGQNASGKSITTQSFIPFILDGDRTPSRLDPFGSNDRRMEYYFLTEDGPEDVTGYLFLEFKREDTGEYRTIGIGQRAQRGKSGMGFWGFVILDGRRLGIDLELYREAGDQYIPLSKQECKNLLGEKNFFTEQQGEYMREVNRQLFGFPRIEQYRQFIQLLIKVRAPKLSKEFKPSRNYEILNDSLQTLTDEDLQAMVEAMEKMDEIEARLENLRETYRDLGIIGREYSRYNQFLLGKKAAAFLTAKKKAADLISDIDGLKAVCADLEEKKADKGRENEELGKAIRILKNDLEVWKDSDVNHAVEEKLRLTRSLEDIEKEVQEAQAAIRRARDEIIRLDGEIRELDGVLEDQLQQISDKLQELDDENETVLFAGHEKLTRLSRGEPDQAVWMTLKKQLHDHIRKVRQAKESLTEWNRRKQRLDREEELLHQLSLRLMECRQLEEAASADQDSCKDDLIEDWYRLQKENQELLISRELLELLCDRIRMYSGDGDRLWTEQEIRALYEKRFLIRKNEALELEHTCKEQEKQRDALEQELKELQEQEEEKPPRRPAVEASRRALAAQGIESVPFYQAVEFADGMSQEACDLLELQVCMAGILDALVVPAAMEEKARKVLAGESDILLAPERTGGRTVGREKGPAGADSGVKHCGQMFPLLVPSPEIGPEMADRVRDILTYISADAGMTEVTGASHAAAVFSADGYFRYGLTEGRAKAEPEETARFIGRAAREQRRQERIRQKETELEAVREELARLKAEQEEAAGRLERLDAEYRERPDLSRLELARKALSEAQDALEKAGQAFSTQEEARDTAADEVKQAELRMLTQCRDLPYERTPDAYDEVLEEAENYQEDMDLLGTLSMSASVTRNQKMSKVREQDTLQEQAEASDLMTRRKRNEMEVVSQKLARVTDLLENPENRAMAERMEHAGRELEEKERLFQDNRVWIGRFEEQLGTREKELAQKKELAIGAVSEEDSLRTYFLEELSLKLVEGYTQEEAAKGLPALAQKAAGLVREGDRSKSHAELISALHGTFSRYSSSIGSYGAAMEDCFGDTEVEGAIRHRSVITASWQGRKLPLPDFTQLVKGSIEDTEQLIQKKDRELFEKILADTLSTKLAQRISESREWIRDMSALMQGMDTSMGLSFSLRWLPRKADGEGRLGTDELETLLRRDAQLMTAEDIGKVAEHFRTDIRIAKREAAEKDQAVNYKEMVRDALDYRRWFEFRMYYTRAGEAPKELTDRAFNRFSGGEKAMAMYVPLFSAVNAQYRKSAKKDHPRIIALDEAFAGVDDINIGSMFELVEKLDFDYIMNSQALWGCYSTVRSLRIVELIRPANAPFVTVVCYTWNGKERVLEEGM
ncbi:MAG: TIGR02680 family protein [Blautia sp.]|nr:TIGR02680 family protein [Blautia sp.]